MDSAYRYLTALLVVDVALQLTLAALGVFRAHENSRASNYVSATRQRSGETGSRGIEPLFSSLWGA
jgi:hypothetical protein